MQGLFFNDEFRHGTLCLLIMDNETSAEVENFLHSKQLPYQYVPAGNHRAKQAERATDTAKSHIISSTSTSRTV